MENELLSNKISMLTENNKELIKPVLEYIVDEFIFSETNKVYLSHGGVASDYVPYEKALILLKKLNVIINFQNYRHGEPVQNTSVHAYDKFEVVFDENTIRRFDNLLNKRANDLVTADSNQAGTQQVKKTNNKTTVPKVNKIDIHRLEPKHYSVRKGVLTLSPIVEISFANKGKTKRKDGTKYLQCNLLERLFYSVYTLNNGVNFRSFLGYNDHLITKKMEKKISNTVSEINLKVSGVGGPKNLIKIQNQKIFVNSSYLE